MNGIDTYKANKMVIFMMVNKMVIQIAINIGDESQGWFSWDRLHGMIDVKHHE